MLELQLSQQKCLRDERGTAEDGNGDGRRPTNMSLRITTWNVNGIRNPFSYQPWSEKRSFNAMFEILEADIVILQETKIQRKDLRDDMVLVPGWDCFFSLPRYEKGKFGVVIYTRQSKCAPIRAEEGLTGILCPPNSETSFRDLPEELQIGGYPTLSQAANAPHASELSEDFALLDSEGRCIILEFPAFVLIGVYNPASRDKTRTPFRIAFLNLLDIRVRNLIALGKRVVLAGDLNIIKHEIDMANAEIDLRKRGTTVDQYFSEPSPRLLNQLVMDGIVYTERDKERQAPVFHDICRVFHPSRKGMFTCWETKINARPGNYGSRIDYILCSLDMRGWFEDSNIQEGLMGSDHCPVYAIVKDKIVLDGKEVCTLDQVNPPGMFEQGVRLRDHSTKDILPLSGRLIKEFNGRRSIRDMFSLKSKSTPSEECLDAGQDLNIGSPRVEQQVESRKEDSPSTSAQAQANLKSKTTTSPLASGMKRRAIGRAASALAKRSKSSSSSSPNATRNNGQQSLKGFFRSDDSSRHTRRDLPVEEHREYAAEIKTEGTANTADGTKDELGGFQIDVAFEGIKADRSFSDGTVQGSSSQLSNNDYQSEVHDPIQSKESWTKLFTKPIAPRCEGHGEPCKTMITKKPGVNCGRSFWICSKPLGPTGNKEKGTEWRCGTFIWGSDWNSAASRSDMLG